MRILNRLFNGDAMGLRLQAVLFAFFIIILIQPVLAIEINKSDFKEPDVTVEINGIGVIAVLKDNKFEIEKVLEEGDSVKLVYKIEPADEETGKEVDDRKYTIISEIDNPVIKAKLYYRNGGGRIFENTPGREYLEVEVLDWEDGMDNINVTVRGLIPSPSSRLQQIRLVYFDIQEAEKDCLPPVVVSVVDYSRFRNDLESLSKRYENVSAILDEYIGKADTSKLADYLEKAEKDISLAEGFYNEKEYNKADEKITNATEWLNNAEKEGSKVKAEYVFGQADKKLKNIGATLDKIEIYLDEVSGMGVLNTSQILDYKTEFRSLQEKANSLAEDFAVAKGYLSEEKYKESEAKSIGILNNADELEREANKMFEELRVLVIPEETPEKTETPETTPTGEMKLPGVDFKLIGIVMGVIIVLAVAGVGIRKYMRRRKWDELK